MNIKNIFRGFCLACTVLMQALPSRAQSVTGIAGGGISSLFIKSDGSLWGMGFNGGQLGNVNSTYYFPIEVLSTNVATVAIGYDSSLIIKNDGSLWVMGGDGWGQLGDGGNGDPTHHEVNIPEEIVSNNVKSVAGGYGHSLFIKTDGSLWAMGYNLDGQLGDGRGNGTFQTTNRPEQIVPNNVTAIAGGGYHSLFIKGDGSLWAMGYNAYGQLGDGTTNTLSNVPELIVASNVTVVAAGLQHSLFLKGDGSLWAMGHNGYGQLGDGTTNNVNVPERIVASNVTAIAAGYWHSLFIKTDGSLWAMGRNLYGQLGDGTTINNATPEQIVSNGVVAVAAGGLHSLFVKNDGSLWSMGQNSNGELGYAYYTYLRTPGLIVAGPLAYNRISSQPLNGGKLRLSFEGISGTNYALERSTSLSPATWTPLITNTAVMGALLVFTNTPIPATNNFYRIHRVP